MKFVDRLRYDIGAARWAEAIIKITYSKLNIQVEEVKDYEQLHETTCPVLLSCLCPYWHRSSCAY